MYIENRDRRPSVMVRIITGLKIWMIIELNEKLGKILSWIIGCRPIS